jgi:hypothetical protein
MNHMWSSECAFHGHVRAHVDHSHCDWKRRCKPSRRFALDMLPRLGRPCSIKGTDRDRYSELVLSQGSLSIYMYLYRYAPISIYQYRSTNTSRACCSRDYDPKQSKDNMSQFRHTIYHSISESNIKSIQIMCIFMDLVDDGLMSRYGCRCSKVYVHATWCVSACCRVGSLSWSHIYIYIYI